MPPLVENSNNYLCTGEGLELNLTDSDIQSTFASTAPEEVVYDKPDARSQRLPTRSDTLPIVERYFQNANNVIPLFDQSSFMQLFNEYYTNSASCTRVKWAAIQVVVALGLRTPDAEASRRNPELLTMGDECLKNAQSVLSDLVTHDEDLLGLQVLLGIVFLLQYSSDHKPASVVIVSAMRLVHRLELHSSEPAQHLSPEDVVQRSRVFWIAYALDKVSKLPNNDIIDSRLTRIGDIPPRENTIHSVRP